jgi:hypothetical protein
MSCAVSTLSGGGGPITGKGGWEIPDVPEVGTERRRIRRSRGARHFRSLAVVILAGSTIILSAVTFTLSKEREDNDFRNQVSGATLFMVSMQDNSF